MDGGRMTFVVIDSAPTRYGAGSERLKRTACSPVASTDSIAAIGPRRGLRTSGSSRRSKVQTTSAEVNGVPSWNVTPWRNSTSSVSPSSLVVHDVASAGCVRPFASIVTRPSTT